MSRPQLNTDHTETLLPIQGHKQQSVNSASCKKIPTIRISAGMCLASVGLLHAFQLNQGIFAFQSLSLYLPPPTGIIDGTLRSMMNHFQAKYE